MRKHDELLVTLRTNPPMSVMGYKTYNPHLAVTPSADKTSPYFTITHIETGTAIARGLTIGKAFKLAAALGGLIDWSGNEKDIEPRFRALPQSWQRWARGLSYL